MSSSSSDPGIEAPDSPPVWTGDVTSEELRYVVRSSEEDGSGHLCIACYTDEGPDGFPKRKREMVPRDRMPLHCRLCHPDIKQSRSATCPVCFNIFRNKEMDSHKRDIHMGKDRDSPSEYYGSFVSGDLRGLTNFEPQGGCDDPHMPHFFRVRCTKCGEPAEQKCAFLTQVVQLSNGCDSANVVHHCHRCSRELSVVMIPGQGKPHTIVRSNKEKQTCIMIFRCFGCEIFDYYLPGTWKAESVHGTVFSIDPSKRSFSGYDDYGDCEVAALRIKLTLKKVKKFYKNGHVRYM